MTERGMEGEAREDAATGVPARFAFEEHIARFDHRLLALVIAGMTSAHGMRILEGGVFEEMQKLTEAVGGSVDTGEEGKPTRLEWPKEAQSRFSSLLRKRAHFETSVQILPPTFLVALVSQYDAYLGSLIRGMYAVQPDRLKKSERQFTLGELLELGTFDEAVSRLVEQQVENTLRSSHVEQFEWLEKQLGVPLREGLPSWSGFVELTQRRNLCVHSDGVVGRQYLEVCRKNDVELGEDLVIGATLEVDRAYLFRAYSTIAEVGLKLGHVLWRVLLPNEEAEVDESINEIAVEHITGSRYSLAIDLLKFALSMPKRDGHSQGSLYLKINLAQAHKWSDKPKACTDMMDQIHWEQLSTKFQIVRATLDDRFSDVVSLVEGAGNDGEIACEQYESWPVFKELRRRDDFQHVFEAVFGRPLPETTGASGDKSGDAPADAPADVAEMADGGEASNGSAVIADPEARSPD